MSDLRANTLSDAAGTGPATLTKQSAAKAWATWSAYPTGFLDSFNASSLTDGGAGIFNVNFTNSFDAANYSTSGNQAWNVSINNYIYLTQPRNSALILAGSLGVYQKYVGASVAGIGDYYYSSITAHGDLA